MILSVVVGDKNTTQYTVKGLSGGQTYYFKIRAGNGCLPGDFSNEVSGTTFGSAITSAASGFEPGVLGESDDKTATDSALASAFPSPSGEILSASATAFGSCTEPWWKWWFITLTVAGFIAAVFAGYHEPDRWKYIAGPTFIAAEIIIWLFFCDKITWMLAEAAMLLLSFGLQKILAVAEN